MKRFGWLFAVLTVFALVAASCGDDDDGGDASADTTAATEGTAAPETTAEPDGEDDAAPPEVDPADLFASAPGVTAETITVGVITPDLVDLFDLGLTDINNGPVEEMWEVLFADINDRGGINGRQLEMVYDKYNPVLNQSADDACLRLTQDNEVFIILGAIAGPAIDSVLCFVEQNPTMMIGGTHTEAHYPRSKVPWFAVGAQVQRRHTATLEMYDELGLLDGRIATYDDSSEHESVTEDVVLPALDEMGIEVVESFSSTIPQGDEVALQAQAETYYEVMKDEDIDTVIIVQSQIAFGIAHLRELGFEGEILAIDSGSLTNTIGGLDERDPATYEGTYSPMGLTRQEAYDDELAQACFAIWEEARPDQPVINPLEVPNREPNLAGGLTAPCQYLQIFTEAATFAGVDLNEETLVAGYDQIGEFSLASVPLASLGPDKYDASDGLRVGVFDSTIGVDGALDPLGELISIAE